MVPNGIPNYGELEISTCLNIDHAINIQHNYVNVKHKYRALVAVS